MEKAFFPLLEDVFRLPSLSQGLGLGENSQRDWSSWVGSVCVNKQRTHGRRGRLTVPCVSGCTSGRGRIFSELPMCFTE